MYIEYVCRIFVEYVWWRCKTTVPAAFPFHRFEVNNHDRSQQNRTLLRAL